MNWEILHESPHVRMRRSGRFLVADLLTSHRVISTSIRHGGEVEGIRYLVNHQSCEGAGHTQRHALMTADGLDAYHNNVCGEAGVPTDATATMGTAANMNYVAIVTETDGDLSVVAAVTAGVEGNAYAAGEPATWRETSAGLEKVPPYAGTINTILIINTPLTRSALVRTIVTMTEGKSAALQRLAVPSKLSVDLATGTGTDQFCVAAPLEGAFTLTSAGPHMKLGELVGLATRNATMEALRWQNGLEPSYTRGVFHALGRYGVREATVFHDVAGWLDASDLELLQKNSKAAFYEPLVGAAAHALAAVADRVRHGSLPGEVAPEAMAQQAACLAAALSARADRWTEFRAVLRQYASDGVKALALRAIALGWSSKWRST